MSIALTISRFEEIGNGHGVVKNLNIVWLTVHKITTYVLFCLLLKVSRRNKPAKEPSYCEHAYKNTT